MCSSSAVDARLERPCLTLAVWMVPVMNVALVCGVAAVMPLAFGRWWLSWLGAAVGVAGALVLSAGPLAAVAVAPWVALGLVEWVQSIRKRSFERLVLAGFTLTAATALVVSRLELTLLGIQEPIVKLTALHFSYAGVGTFALAGALLRVRATFTRRLVVAVVVLAPPLVATGFITKLALFQVGGAVVMAVGVLAVATLEALEAVTHRGAVRWLLIGSSLAPWVAMGLGVAWAANQYWPEVPALTVPDMVPTHGALNAFGFVLPGLLARRLLTSRSALHPTRS